jgi:multisubunit Na+/H+ antiporter MnhC subunit
MTKSVRVVGRPTVFEVCRSIRTARARKSRDRERGSALVESLVMTALVAGLAVMALSVVPVLVDAVVTYLAHLAVNLSSPPQF